MVQTGESELGYELAERQLAERVAALALTAFSRDELDGMPAEQRTVLNVLLKRRLRQDGTEPGVGDCLLIRQQFERFCERRFGDPAAMRLAAQLR